MPRTRATIMTPALVLFAFVAIVLGIIGGLFFLDTHSTFYATDDNAIHLQAQPSQLRDVLWEPAHPLALPGFESTDEYEPKLSPDGNTLFLVRGKPGENADIYLSHRTIDGWTTPEAFDEINSSADDLGPAPTPDGQAIYFYSNRAGSLGGYDIWLLRRGEDRWLEPVNLGDAVNSPFNDYGPAIDAAASTLYFASNRPRGTENSPDPDRWRATLREDLFSNDYDLYSAPISDTEPSQATPLRDLNSDRNEGAPAVSPFNDFLYFASDRQGGQGGYDLYRSRRSNNQWLPPASLGDAINSIAHDLDPTLGLGGFQLFFSSNRPLPTIDGQDQPESTYGLFTSMSREVFAQSEKTQASMDWPAILTNLMWLLLLLLLLLALLALLRRLAASGKLGKLSLLSKMLILALLLHTLLMFFQITNTLGPGFNPSGGTQVQLTTSAGADPLANQIRGNLTDLALNAPETPTSIDLPLLMQLDTRSQTAELEALQHDAAEAEQLADHDADDAQALEFTQTASIDEPLPEQQIETDVDTPVAQKLARAAEADLTLDVQQAPATSSAPTPVDAQPESVLVDADDAQSPNATDQLAIAVPLTDAPQTIDIQTSTPQESLVDSPTESAVASPADANRQQSQETLLAVQALPAGATSAPPIQDNASSAQTALLDADNARSVESSNSISEPVILADALQTVDLQTSTPQTSLVDSPLESTVASPADANRQQSQETLLAVQALPSTTTPSAPLQNNSSSSQRAQLSASTSAAPDSHQIASSQAHDATISQPVASSLPAAANQAVPNPINTKVATPTQLQQARAQEATLDHLDAKTPQATSSNAPLLAQAAPTDTPMQRLPIDTTQNNSRATSLADDPSAQTSDTNASAIALNNSTASDQIIDIPDAFVDLVVDTPNELASHNTNAEPVLAARTPSQQSPQTSSPSAAPTPIQTDRVDLAVDAQNPAQSPSTLARTTDTPQDAQLLPMPGIMANLPDAAINLPLDDIALRDIPVAALPDLPTEQNTREETSAPRVAAAQTSPISDAPAVEISSPELALTDTFESLRDISNPAPADAFDLDLPAPDANQPALAVITTTQDTLDVSFPDIPTDSFSLPSELTPPNEEYAQRDEDVREKVVEEMGGSEETEDAVQLALAWLARVQSDDGRWDTDGFDDGCLDCPDASAGISSDIALTGLALLCFQGAGNTHINPGPYRETVERGIQFLLTSQSASGDLRSGETMYSQGIATIALAEAYGMTSDELLRDPVERAVAYIIGARNRATRAPIGNRRAVGGWRYAPGQVGDTSVLGWQVMALKSATRAGIEIPQQIFDYAGQWLDQVQIKGNDGLYAYQPGDPPTFSMTAESMFVRQLLGDTPDDARMHRSVAYLLQEQPSWDNRANTYGWYYATLALFQHQGEAWNAWNQHIRDVLVDAQIVDGPAIGSWPTQDRWSRIGGRIYQTAICTLSLEVYYRYLPRFLNEIDDDTQSINAGE